MRDNADVVKQKKELSDNWYEGYEAGYAANPNIPPPWYFSKVPSRLTPYERGFWWGRELRIQEMREQEA